MSGASVEERYLLASNASDLSVIADQACDADKLLAAAYAAMGDARRNLALKVWRIRSTTEMSGAHQLAEELGALLRSSASTRSGRYLRRAHAERLTELQSKDIAMMTLKWWSKPKCPVCAGHGHPVIPNTPVLNLNRVCRPCDGKGQVQLERLVRTEFIEPAKWLVSEMEGLSAMVFADMAKLLRVRMDL